MQPQGEARVWTLLASRTQQPIWRRVRDSSFFTNYSLTMMLRQRPLRSYMPFPRRGLVVPAIITVLLFLGLLTRSSSSGDGWFPASAGPIVPVTTAGRVAIYESAIHDEVVGSIAHALDAVGIQPTFHSHFRFGFREVLSHIVSYEPKIIGPGIEHIIKAIQEEAYDHIILPTCYDSLPRLNDHLLKAKVHVICVAHYSGGSMFSLQKHLKPMAHAGRLSLITLGPHTWRGSIADFEHWADQESAPYWTNTKIELLIPTYVFPPNKSFEQPDVFPSKAVIQGNLDMGRRNYPKVFEHLHECLKSNAAEWGYEWDPLTKKYAPLKGGVTPFHLSLLGQKYERRPLVIPDELTNMISVHERLPYPDFYTIISEADVLLPAFAIPGSTRDTASSSIAAAVIARTPVLAPERYFTAYTYIRDGPSNVLRDNDESEVHAILRMRRSGYKRPSPAVLKAQWAAKEEEIRGLNAQMWHRMFDRFAK